MKLKETLLEILEHVTTARVDIAEIRKDLKYHIKRTDLLEKRLDAENVEMGKQLSPLTAIYHFLKIFGVLLAASAAAAAVLKLFL